MRRAGAAVLACAIIACAGCLRRPTTDPKIIVASMTTGPNNLDPRTLCRPARLQELTADR